MDKQELPTDLEPVKVFLKNALEMKSRVRFLKWNDIYVHECYNNFVNREMFIFILILFNNLDHMKIQRRSGECIYVYQAVSMLSRNRKY